MMGSDQFTSRKHKYVVILLALLLSLFAAGCKKKVPPPAPPPPPPPKVEPEKPKPAAPTVSSFEAEPSTIERGQPATLRWTVTGDVTEVRIEPGIGTVNANGNRQVFPGNTTTYNLTASGPGGTARGAATVTVTSPPPPPPPKVAPKPTASEFLERNVQDAYFDYDKSDIRDDARQTLTQNAGALRTLFQDYPNVSVVLEGHADERGSAEYNLGLADRRSTAAKEFLVQLGISADRLKPVSYGKERPQCTESNESCWQRNRRVHFSIGQ
jgi:peptidoglycan-associated lipoprotein